jgi:hypothetical protein
LNKQTNFINTFFYKLDKQIVVKKKKDMKNMYKKTSVWSGEHAQTPPAQGDLIDNPQEEGNKALFSLVCAYHQM